MGIEILSSRKNGKKIVCLTAYTAPMAACLDEHVDLILVGDSLGMVLYGMANTRNVDIEMMCRHGAAVTQSVRKAWVVVDMPYGSYEDGPEQACANARHIMERTGCHAVKLEGGRQRADSIAHIVDSGIPVMGHIGLLPQDSTQGYRVQGGSEDDRNRLLQDADAVEKAGAFACVIEATRAPVAREITQKMAVPTIGIGATKACDGQILVSEDMLGMTQGKLPRFVKCYSDLAGVMGEAARNYCDEVRSGAFPDDQHVYGDDNDVG